MQRWECYSEMIQGGIDGMRDALAGAPRSTNANRSHSYCYAYGEGYASGERRVSRPRDRVAEELAIAADIN
jgi:hypothetical protein